jgi:hypothetical protein
MSALKCQLIESSAIVFAAAYQASMSDRSPSRTSTATCETNATAAVEKWLSQVEIQIVNNEEYAK